MSDDPERKDGPGPAHYFLPSTVGHNNHDISKSRSPSFSMGVRLPGMFCEQNVQSPSPGPKYQVEYLTKYGKANIASSISNFKEGRTKSYVGPDSRNRSLDRSEARYAYSRQENSKDMNDKSNSRHYNNLFDNGKNLKAEDIKAVNLRAFCREFGDTTNVKKPRVSSARRHNGNSPRYRTDVRRPRY